VTRVRPSKSEKWITAPKESLKIKDKNMDGVETWYIMERKYMNNYAERIFSFG